MSAVIGTNATQAGSPPPDYSQLVEAGLAGPNILLNGESGTGKTHALGTLVDWAQRNGFEAFYFDVENSLETLLGYWRTPVDGSAAKPVPKCLHWRQVHVAPVTLKQMIQGAKDTGELSYELLTKKQDPDRGSNNAFWKILNDMADFKDDRDGGKGYGPVDKFTSKQIFILDSFTELSNAAAKMVIGAKPTMAPPDYGVAQNHLMNFLRLMCHGTRCTFVMTSHPSRDKDEVTGTVRTSVSTIGTAIQPQITPLFSEVLYAVREGSKFTWDTAAYGVVAKTRYLGYKSGHTPDFALIMDQWLKRGGK